MARNSKKDDNYPVVAPFLLPDDRLVLLDVDKSIYEMTRTLAWYLGCPPSFINLAMDMTCGGQVRTAEITSGAWPACLTVFVEPVKIQLTPKKPLPEEDAAKPFTVYVRTLTGKTFKTRCNANTTVHGLKEIVHTFEGAPPDQQRLIFNSLQLAGEDEYTLHDYDIGPDAVVNMVMKLRGGKPVIYVMPPKPMSVTVKVSLVPEWRFTTVYPVVPTIANPDGEHVEWTVDATPDGVLTTAGTQAMYLFWEADTTGITDKTSVEFNPARPVVNTDTAVVLPTNEVHKYLDTALTAMGLTIGARTDFMTYWLPKMHAHKHVALRFLPQAAYARAAPLTTTPAPDVVNRVFMLFKGVKDLTAEWAKISPAEWASIVGIDDRVHNTELFRVVEWGGMEVME